jgi:HTH-type transcriptional regulator / antitoxin HipB
MDDLNKFILEQKQSDPSFADGFDEGYEAFKIGALLKEIRVEQGLTQDEVALKMHTKKTAISRIENHGDNVRLTTLEKFATALGKKMVIQFQ